MADITTTLVILLQAEPALARLGAERLPIQAAYRVAKLTKLVRAELEEFHAQRHASIKELGAMRDATPLERAQGLEAQVVGVLPEHLPEFTQRMQELGEIVVTLPCGPLTLDLLEGVSMSAGDLLLLGPLLEE